jgi:tol-pal system protein YbgF
MKTLFRLLAFATATAVVAATPSSAAPSRAELDARVQILESRALSTEARLNEVEGVLLTGDPAAVRLANRMDELEATLKRVTGDLEKSQFENRQLKEELRTLRREVDLIDRQRSFGFTDPASSAASSGASPTSTVLPDGSVVIMPGARPAEADPRYFGSDPIAADKAAATRVLGSNPVVTLPDNARDALEFAKRLLVQGRFVEAEEAFARFAATYPDDANIGEALFWQGETFYLRDAFGSAKDLYVESLRKAPSGAKAPDAMVKLAASLTSLNEPERACATLKAMRQKFPSPSATIRSAANQEAQRARCAA